jgi:hypothetical protein
MASNIDMVITVAIVVGLLLVAAVYFFVGQSNMHKAHIAAYAAASPLNSMDVANAMFSKAQMAGNVAQQATVSAVRAGRDTQAELDQRMQLLKVHQQGSQVKTLHQLNGATTGGAPTGGEGDDSAFEARTEGSLFRRRRS